MRVWTVLAVTGLLVCVFFSAGLGPLLEPLLYTMTPLQRYYAGDYLVSSLRANDPAATTRTRLLWKERLVPGPPNTPKASKAKGKKPETKFENEFALERDVRPLPVEDRIGKYDPEPFALSEEARAEGWTSVSRDYPHQVTLAALHGFLEEGIYDGHSLWRFLLQPAAGLLVLLTLALAFHRWRLSLRRRYPWRTDGEAMWLVARTWSAASAGRLSEGVRRPNRVRELEGAKPETRRELPAPQPVAAASVTGSQPQPPAVPPPAAVPPRRAFVWSESEGID